MFLFPRPERPLPSSLPKPKPDAALGPAFWALLGAAFVLPRLALWWVSTGAASDLQSYALVEAALRAGRPLYLTPQLAFRYPYPPAWAWTLEGLGRLARARGFAFYRLVKLPGLLCEAGIVWLLLRWEEGGRLLDARARKAAAWAYALSPVSWLVTAGHGQFDAVVLFFVLGAARAWGRPGRRAALEAGAWMGVAICFKQWPLFLLPFFFAFRPGSGTSGRKGRGEAGAFAVFLAAALGLPLLCLAPYAAAEGGAAVWSHLRYSGVAGLGLDVFTRSRLLGLPSAAVPAWVRTMEGALAAFWLLSWRRRRRTDPGPSTARLARSLGLGLLALLVLSPNVSPQYLLWPLPFLALARPRWAWVHGAGCGTFLTAFYLWFFPAALLSGTHGPLLPVSHMAWVWPLANLALWTALAWEWWSLSWERRGGAPGPLRG